MKKPSTDKDFPDIYHDTYSKTIFGFWIYLLTDFVLFGTLFAAYAVLKGGTFGGPTPKELFHLPFTLIQTLILLVSTFTIGIAGAYMHRGKKNEALALFALSFLLGIFFMGMQFTEFTRFVHEGNSWHNSAFLSAYFTLNGTFALHMFFALLWIIVLALPVWKEGLTAVSVRRLTCLKMFWQFLNVIWVFIFSFVYLMG